MNAEWERQVLNDFETSLLESQLWNVMDLTVDDVFFLCMYHVSDSLLFAMFKRSVRNAHLGDVQERVRRQSTVPVLMTFCSSDQCFGEGRWSHLVIDFRLLLNCHKMRQGKPICMRWRCVQMSRMQRDRCADE